MIERVVATAKEQNGLALVIQNDDGDTSSNRFLFRRALFGGQRHQLL
jgi:hypothetical protein